MGKYYIYSGLEVRKGRRGLGVYALCDIPSQTIVEVSPFSSCFSANWANTPESLRKIVFSYPQNSDNYVIGLGYSALYNHDDNCNCEWLTGEESIIIKTLRQVSANEELTINYGEAYWSGGWEKI